MLENTWFLVMFVKYGFQRNFKTCVDCLDIELTYLRRRQRFQALKTVYCPVNDDQDHDCQHTGIYVSTSLMASFNIEGSDYTTLIDLTQSILWYKMHRLTSNDPLRTCVPSLHCGSWFCKDVCLGTREYLRKGC